MILTIIIFFVILSVLVLVHELGHFLVAKKLGVKVEEFGFGLPPRAFGVKRGETIYSINWLPIGGFVKLYGEDEAGGGSIKLSKKEKVKDEKRAFYARSVLQRASIVIAGVVMNFALAVVILTILFSVIGIPVPGDKVLIGQVIKGSPAEMVGIREGDMIVSFNNDKLDSPQELIDKTRSNLGKEVTLKVLPKGKGSEKEIKVTPRTDYPSDQGPLGISISQSYEVKKYPIWEAPILGTKEALNQSWLILSGIGMIFSQLLTQGSVPAGVAGPVGIAQLTGVLCQEVGSCLSFVGLLSLNLAILNILPIPALDGGRLFFILIEGITRRKVSRKFETYAHALGMALLLGLIALITLHDLIRVFTGQDIIPR